MFKAKFLNRQRYIDKIAPSMGNIELIKVFVGQRRVGKSYLMYQLMESITKKDSDANIIYINKEHFEFDHINDYKILNATFKAQKKEGKNNYLLIDEIQEIEHFEKSLRSIHAKQEAEIIITGSNANILSSDLSTFLSGRYVEIKVYGLSYNEFLEFHSLQKSQNSFNKYLRYGGLPGLKNFTLNDTVVYDYLKNIYATILYKDVIRRNNIRNVIFLENLVRYLADNTGSIVSANKISDYLKSQKINISTNVVLDYLSYVNAAYFVSKVQRTTIQGKKIFEVGDKYYFEDLGLRNSIIGFRQNDINKILENVVFTHLLIAGYNVKIGWENGREIDFVCERESERLYIQVAYLITDDKVREREFGNLLKIKDNYPKMVLSLDPITGDSYKGIIHQHVMDFIASI